MTKNESTAKPMSMSLRPARITLEVAPWTHSSDGSPLSVRFRPSIAVKGPFAAFGASGASHPSHAARCSASPCDFGCVTWQSAERDLSQ